MNGQRPSGAGSWRIITDQKRGIARHLEAHVAEGHACLRHTPKPQVLSPASPKVELLPQVSATSRVEKGVTDSKLPQVLARQASDTAFTIKILRSLYSSSGRGGLSEAAVRLARHAGIAFKRKSHHRALLRAYELVAPDTAQLAALAGHFAKAVAGDQSSAQPRSWG